MNLMWITRNFEKFEIAFSKTNFLPEFHLNCPRFESLKKSNVYSSFVPGPGGGGHGGPGGHDGGHDSDGSGEYDRLGKLQIHDLWLANQN